MTTKSYVYRCPLRCPIHKHCFVIKLAEPLSIPLTVFQKCVAKKRDIEIKIGEEHQP